MDKFVKLSRAEMKEILGGKDEGCHSFCSTDDDCMGSFTCDYDGSSVCPYRKSCI
jgi:hypothetical protein